MLPSSNSTIISIESNVVSEATHILSNGRTSFIFTFIFSIHESMSSSLSRCISVSKTYLKYTSYVILIPRAPVHISRNSSRSFSPSPSNHNFMRRLFIISSITASLLLSIGNISFSLFIFFPPIQYTICIYYILLFYLLQVNIYI